MSILFSIIEITHNNKVYTAVTNEENAIDDVSNTNLVRQLSRNFRNNDLVSIVSHTYYHGKGKCYHASIADIHQIQENPEPYFSQDTVLVCESACCYQFNKLKQAAAV